MDSSIRTRTSREWATLMVLKEELLYMVGCPDSPLSHAEHKHEVIAYIEDRIKQIETQTK